MLSLIWTDHSFEFELKPHVMHSTPVSCDGRLRLSALQASHCHKHVQGKTRMTVSQCFMHHAMERCRE